jgi:hypothetical protein
MFEHFAKRLKRFRLNDAKRSITREETDSKQLNLSRVKVILNG